MLFSNLLSLLSRNLSFVWHIAFVSNEHFHDVRIRILIDAIQPVLDVLERFQRRQVERENDSVSILVQGVSDGTESFLASSVPHFNRDFLPLGVDPLHQLEVHSHSRNVILIDLFFVLNGR